MYRHFFKPILDFFIAFLGFLLISPIYLILMVVIKIDSKGPVFFKQKRVGKKKKLFNIYKFRTMHIDTPHDVPTHQLTNPEQYITRVGKFLRKTSLDELPQIINILRGNMSIVGPRPALWNQVDLITERERFGVNRIRPGLTGLAQISGRDELTIADKVKLDSKYLESMGFLGDIKIFCKTIIKVLKRDGVVEGGTGNLVNQNLKDMEPNQNGK